MQPVIVGVQIVMMVMYFGFSGINHKSQFLVDDFFFLFVAEPFINKYCIENGATDSVFIIVDVGDRPM